MGNDDVMDNDMGNDFESEERDINREQNFMGDNLVDAPEYVNYFILFHLHWIHLILFVGGKNLHTLRFTSKKNGHEKTERFYMADFNSIEFNRSKFQVLKVKLFLTHLRNLSFIFTKCC